MIQAQTSSAARGTRPLRTVGVDSAVDQPQGIGQGRGFEICAVGADDDFDAPAPLVQARD